MNVNSLSISCVIKQLHPVNDWLWDVFSQHPPDFQSFDKLLNFKFITPSAQ